jgi:hypothetical protein
MKCMVQEAKKCYTFVYMALKITANLCFMPFCFNVPCQFTQILNLHSLVLCLLAEFYYTNLVQWNLGSRTPLITNKSVHEQIFRRKKKSRVTNGVSSNEHTSRQQRLATSWEYRRESISCCVTFAQYTSLLEFAVPSLEFHCVLWFFIYY